MTDADLNGVSYPARRFPARVRTSSRRPERSRCPRRWPRRTQQRGDVCLRPPGVSVADQLIYRLHLVGGSGGTQLPAWTSRPSPDSHRPRWPGSRLPPANGPAAKVGILRCLVVERRGRLVAKLVPLKGSVRGKNAALALRLSTDRLWAQVATPNLATSVTEAYPGPEGEHAGHRRVPEACSVRPPGG